MNEILEDLRIWRKDRNITTPELDIKKSLLDEWEEAKYELDMKDHKKFVVELADIVIFALNWISLKEMPYMHKVHSTIHGVNMDSLKYHLSNLNIHNSINSYSHLLDAIYICKELSLEYGYDLNKVILEKIKVISSREQDPKQKEEWAKGVKSEKWKKNENQNPLTIYYVIYENCEVTPNAR